MPICTVGQVVTLPVDVRIIKTFAHEDRIYYIAKPTKSFINSIWIVTTDGIPLDPTPEILKKAYRILGRV